MTTPLQVFREIEKTHATGVEKLVADRFFEHVFASNPNHFPVDVSFNSVSGLQLLVTGEHRYVGASFTPTNTFPEPPAGPINSLNILEAQQLLLQPNTIGDGAMAVSDLAWGGRGLGYGALTENLFGDVYTVKYGHHVTTSVEVGLTGL